MDSVGHSANSISTEKTISLNAPFEAPPRTIDPLFLPHQSPMDSSFADWGSWIPNPSITANLQAQKVVGFPLFQDSAANVLDFLTPDNYDEGCQTLGSTSFSFQPQSQPFYSEARSSEDMLLFGIKYVPRKVLPSPKKEPSLRSPDWEVVENNVRYLSNEGWSKKEMVTASRVSHPGIDIA